VIKKRYYALTTKDNEASIYIFGDIVSWEWFENEVSSYTLAKEIEGLDVDVINVYINSYGGEVAEGLAIYNQLRRHRAKIKTYCDGFACSAASVVFMAGDERIMSNASLLMIHNAWMHTAGDQNHLRKDADDLETINQASVNAYLNHVAITEDELKAMLDAETWISPAEAVKMGFATAMAEPAPGGVASQSYQKRLMEMVLGKSRQVAMKLEVDVEKLADVLEARIKELVAQDADPEPEPDPDPEPEPQDNKLGKLLLALFTHEKERGS